MIIKNFRFNVVVRIIFLIICIFLFVYLFLNTSLYATQFIVASLIIVTIFNLIYYVQKTNQQLTRFFDAIKHSDFSQSFSAKGLGSGFKELNAAFSQVILAFQASRSEKEEHYRYLHTVVRHVGVALIAFNKQGDVQLINTAAKRLLKTNHLKHIDGLNKLSPQLVEKLKSLHSGDKSVVKVTDKDDILQLAIQATEFKLHAERFTLVSIQDIQGELEEKEMDAWHNLIRVLTHEIMNSITPISSLASTVNDLLPDKVDKMKSDSDLEDIRTAVETIQNRSEGLLNFVDTYRSLTRVPKPNFQIIKVEPIFARLFQLHRRELEDRGIQFRKSANPKSLELTADPQLIEQVLINLIVNSMQAFSETENAVIELKAMQNERGRMIIQVIDNGPGISEDVLEKIFIPFYTTKKKGSGIGLSLCRQIMRLHNGSIAVNSTKNKQTIFTLRF